MMKFFISFVNQNFSNKPSDISDESWAFLRSVYSSVEDIDLFVGGLLEKRIEGQGVLGYMFGLLVAEQFRRLKDDCVSIVLLGAPFRIDAVCRSDQN